jgi:hypothetical protein
MTAATVLCVDISDATKGVVALDIVHVLLALETDPFLRIDVEVEAKLDECHHFLVRVHELGSR